VVTALFGAEVAAEADLARLALHGEAGLDPLRPAELRRGMRAKPAEPVAPDAPPPS
jgi:hypothetical protein